MAEAFALGGYSAGRLSSCPYVALPEGLTCLRPTGEAGRERGRALQLQWQ